MCNLSLTLLNNAVAADVPLIGLLTQTIVEKDRSWSTLLPTLWTWKVDKSVVVTVTPKESKGDVNRVEPRV